LEILVQRRRDRRAAKKFLRKLLKGFAYVPRLIITDKLKSYGAAKCERRMQRFKSAGHAQRFLSAYGPIAQCFRPRRHRLSAPVYHQELENSFHFCGFAVSSASPAAGRSCVFMRILGLPQVNQQIVAMPLNGSGVRDIARGLQVGPNTVVKELKKALQENEWVKFDVFTGVAAYR
jgi:hypothetical protein